MKKIILQIKKYLGEILLIAGGVITIYNVFGFMASRGDGLVRIGSNGPVSYYYTNDTQLMIAIGVGLIIMGILIIKNRRK